MKYFKKRATNEMALLHARFSLLAKLYQHSIGSFWMQETNQFIICSVFRGFVEELKTEGAKTFHFRFNIFDFKGNMVYTRTFLINKFRYGTIFFRGFEQLYFSIPREEKGSIYPF